MIKTLHKALLAVTLIPASMAAQSITPFSDQTSLLPETNIRSGNAVGVCDMNGDFKDDIVRDSSNRKMFICFQQMPNAAFTETRYNAYFSTPWGLCIGDYNNDGFNDVFQGSGSHGYLLTSNSAATFSRENMDSIYGGGSVFTQGCNFADIDNDGNLDLFICHDTGMPKVYMGSGNTGSWTFNQAVMPLAQVPSSDNSGNYASIWTDVNADGLIDLMITHCRQSITQPTDARRIDQVFINNGNGTYTQDVTNWTNLRDGAQGWSTAWGDFDNDGDMDAFVLNYDVESKMMVNNGAGVFTDIFPTIGVASTANTYFGENATWHDFDNDGFLDLLITGDEHYLYRNNGNATFTLVSNQPFPYYSTANPPVLRQIRGQGVGDLNDDGFLDVYASYANLYNSASGSKNDHVWMNTCVGNGNNWVKYNLVGGATPGMSNKNGIGAIVKIYGAWGIQVREVRSGEGYGLQNSLSLYFGLGTATTIDSAVIIWPSGIVDHIANHNVDAAYTLNEGITPTGMQTAAVHPFRMSMGPNPMNDQLTVQMFNTDQYGLNNMSVQILDLNGKVVYSQKSLISNVLVIDNANLASGVYMLQISNGDEHLATEKLIVQ
jgi:hypothetical protein